MFDAELRQKFNVLLNELDIRKETDAFNQVYRAMDKALPYPPTTKKVKRIK